MLFMVKIICFSAVVNFAYSIVSCSTDKLTDKPVLNAQNAPMKLALRKVLQQLGFSEVIEDLRYSELGALINELLWQIDEEKYRRLALGEYIDINEKATTFLKECYPKWGSYRHLKNTTEEYWKIVFCNWEEPNIVGLKTFLKENKLSEETFITVLNSKIVTNRNMFMSHHTPEVGIASTAIWVALTAILYVAIGDISTVVRNSTFRDEVYHQMKVDSQAYRLMRIPTIEHFRTQELIREELKAFAKNKTLKEPVSIYIVDKTTENVQESNSGAYILFDTFENAIKFFNGRNEMDFFLR